MNQWDDRFRREEERFERSPVRTGFKWLVTIVVAFMVIAAVFGFARFVLGWFGAGAEIVGPENVKKQYALVIEGWESLQQQAENACAAENVPERANSPTFLEDPAFAYQAKYRETRTDYNRRMNNLFEAGVVAPSGYPRSAPTLEAMQVRVC